MQGFLLVLGREMQDFWADDCKLGLGECQIGQFRQFSRQLTIPKIRTVQRSPGVFSSVFSSIFRSERIETVDFADRCAGIHRRAPALVIVLQGHLGRGVSQHVLHQLQVMGFTGDICSHGGPKAARRDPVVEASLPLDAVSHLSNPGQYDSRVAQKNEEKLGNTNMRRECSNYIVELESGRDKTRSQI